jgi:hypothetical protein
MIFRITATMATFDFFPAAAKAFVEAGGIAHVRVG